jgi:ABC-type branched-subunit amino acid transport system substrate-binding protein
MLNLFSRRRATLLAALAAAVAAAACGSSASSSAPPAASGATHSPLLIGSFASITSPIYTNPNDEAGLWAAVDGINARGGVNGHPLKLIFCDSHQEASAEVDCAEQLVSDKVIAAVSPLVTADATGREWQIFQSAGIPVIGTVGALPAELANPDVYPLGAGLPGWDYGAAALLVSQGIKKIAIVDDTTAPAQFNGVLAVQALKLAGITPVADVTADPSSDPTLAAAAAKVAQKGVQGILLLTSPPNVPKMLAAIRQTGYKGKISTVDGELQTQIVQAIGSQGNGLEVSSLAAFATDSANPGIAAFKADMASYQPKAGVDSDSLRTWSAVQLFAKVAAGAKAYTAAEVAAAMLNLSTPVDIATIAPYTVKGRKSPLAQYPRLLNPMVQYGVLQNGVVKPDGKGFVNPFQQLAAG